MFISLSGDFQLQSSVKKRTSRKRLKNVLRISSRSIRKEKGNQHEFAFLNSLIRRVDGDEKVWRAKKKVGWLLEVLLVMP